MTQGYWRHRYEESRKERKLKVTVFPADTYGCGFFRLIWVSRILAARGHDVTLVYPGQRKLEVYLDDDGETVRDVGLETDVAVFQRITHSYMAQVVSVLRSKGTTVVVDVDDDLSSVHPSNPAYAAMHPSNERRVEPGQRQPRRHSWRNLSTACRDATMVTVSTPALLNVYARHGRGRVLPNYLPDTYYGVPHQDSDVIGWPAALSSHPDDPSAVGGAIARLVAAGTDFRIIGDPAGCGQAYGLTADPGGLSGVDINGWPAAVATLGIGIAPLADTRFNACKSWLKPLEMSALGVPWVASPRPEYARLHRKGAGLLADNPRRWYRTLEQLRHSPTMRAEVSAAGKEVAEGLRLANHAEEWLEAWSDAAQMQHGALTAQVIAS